MLLVFLVYGYCRGVRSSRQIERLCITDVAFRVLCAQDVPDHCTIVRFRSDCQHVFEDLFTQVLLIAAQSGLARFGTVAIDGTKIPANASIDANRGHDWLQQQVRDTVAAAKAVDAVEDTSYGTDAGPDDRVPSALADQSNRKNRIRVAAERVAQQLASRTREQTTREEAALARRCRSEAGLPMVGWIPEGPHRLAEAEANPRQVWVVTAWPARWITSGLPMPMRPAKGILSLLPEYIFDRFRLSEHSALQRAPRACVATVSDVYSVTYRILLLTSCPRARLRTAD